MRKLREDIKDVTRWSPCRKRPVVLKVTRKTTGMVYYNPYDQSTSVADRNTPILFTDDAGAYWTDTVYNLKHRYMQADGTDIDADFLHEIVQGEFAEVRPRSEELWAFKVAVDVYRWDCPYGANASEMQHGDGDYLVCCGERKPDLRTIKLVRNGVYKRFYMERST